MKKSQLTTITAALSLSLMMLSQTNAATTIVQNGSFETNTAVNGGYQGNANELGANPELTNAFAAAGTVTGWSGTSRAWLFNDYTSNSNFSDGDYAAFIDARSNLGGIDVLAQTGISLDAGRTYTLSFDMWAANVALTEGLDVRLTYGFGDELDYTDGTGLTLIDEKTTVGNNGFFETVTLKFSPTVTNANYAIQFFMDGTGVTNNHAYIDNVQIVPEPSSTALLGLGLSALLLRRRR